MSYFRAVERAAYGNNLARLLALPYTEVVRVWDTLRPRLDDYNLSGSLDATLDTRIATAKQTRDKRSIIDGILATSSAQFDLPVFFDEIEVAAPKKKARPVHPWPVTKQGEKRTAYLIPIHDEGPEASYAWAYDKGYRWRTDFIDDGLQGYTVYADGDVFRTRKEAYEAIQEFVTAMNWGTDYTYSVDE